MIDNKQTVETNMFTPLDILIMSVFHPPREKIQRVLKN
jgi:hypothetical protein